MSGQKIAAQEWKGVQVGLWNPEGWLNSEAESALLGTARQLETLGATLTPVLLPDMLDAYSDTVQSEAAAVHHAALALPAPGFSAGTLALLRRGAALTPEQLAVARERQEVYAELLEQQMHGLDLLLTPAVPSAAPLTGQDDVQTLGGNVPLRLAVLRLTVPFSLLGWPVLTLPCPAPDGLSVGVQLVGRPGDDARLLGLGRSLEARRAANTES